LLGLLAYGPSTLVRPLIQSLIIVLTLIVLLTLREGILVVGLTLTIGVVRLLVVLLTLRVCLLSPVRRVFPVTIN